MDKAVIYALYQAADNLRNEGPKAETLKNQIEEFIQREANEEVKKGITPNLMNYRFIHAYNAIMNAKATKNVTKAEGDRSLAPNCTFTHDKKHYILTSRIVIGGIRKRYILLDDFVGGDLPICEW